jgi:hypothetical protein
MRPLGDASNGPGWWGTADELGEPPKVLRGSCEQHLVPNAAQSSQSKPVEFENALHVRKPHLNFLALATRLQEGFGIGESANVVSHILVDVTRDLAGV